MAANQHRAPIQLGFAPQSPNSGSAALSINGAQSGSYSATWLAFGFRLDQAKTLSKIQVYCSSVNGTLGATDLVCDIYSNTSGSPNASLATTNTVTATPTGAAWVEFTGFSLALSPATQYWIVLRNANSAPTTNYPNYQFGQQYTAPTLPNGGNYKVGWSKQHSTTSGGTWGVSTNAAACGWRLQFSDGTYDGLPVQSLANGSDKAYGANEVGVRFTVPSGAKWNVRGAVFYVLATGTPTGNLYYRLYQNGAYVASTNGILPADVIAAGGYYLPDYFASDITVNPGDVITVTIADGAADSSSNNYFSYYEYKFASDPNTQALMPFEGTLEKAITANGGSGSPTFTLTPTSIYPFALLLDTAGEFGSAGGGYLPRLRTGGN
jgi:hypothetical protein